MTRFLSTGDAASLTHLAAAVAAAGHAGAANMQQAVAGTLQRQVSIGVKGWLRTPLHVTPAVSEALTVLFETVCLFHTMMLDLP
jgi:hypothetical protein